MNLNYWIKYNKKNILRVAMCLVLIISASVGLVATRGNHASSFPPSIYVCDNDILVSNPNGLYKQSDDRYYYLSGGQKLLIGYNTVKYEPDYINIGISIDGGLPVDCTSATEYEGHDISLYCITYNYQNMGSTTMLNTHFIADPQQVQLSYTEILDGKSTDYGYTTRPVISVSKKSVDALDCDLYYSVNQKYTNASQIKSSAIKIDGSSFEVVDSETAVQYYIYGVDVFDRVTVIDGPSYDHVDGTSPSVNVTYCNYKSKSNGVYYYDETSKGDVAVTIDSSDAISGYKTSGLKQGNPLELCEKVTAGNVVNEQIRLNGDLSETVEYSDELTITDNDGNTTVSKIGTIVYDATSPKIVQFNSDYTGPTNQPISVSFEVEERNLKDVTASVGSQDVPVEKQENGSYKIVLSDMEIYNQPLKIKAIDMVGHADTYVSDNITLDMTPLNMSMYIGYRDILKQTGYIKKNTIIDCDFDGDDIGSIKLTLLDKDDNALSTEPTGKLHDTHYTISLPQTEDGIYKLKVDVTDTSGNTSSFTTKNLIFDNQAPVVNISPEDNTVSFSVSEDNVSNDEIMNAHLQVFDNEQEFDTISFSVNGTDYKQSIIYFESYLSDISHWVKKDNTYTLSVTFDTEANYRIDATASDLSGNTSDNVSAAWFYDVAAPVFEKAEFSSTRKNYNDYGYISKDGVMVTITAKDNVSTVDEVVINYIENGSEKKQTCSKNNDVFVTSFGQTSGQKVSIQSIKLTDSHKNTNTVKFEDGIIVDKETEPVELLHANIEDDTNGKSVVNSNINLNMSMADSFSGIASYSFRLNKEKKDKDFTNSKNITYQYEFQDSLDAQKNEGDNIVAALTVQDNAGNQSEIKKQYSIDVTNPDIRVSYDTTNASGFYNQTRIANISITEKHFNPDGVELIVIKDRQAAKVPVTFRTSDDIHFTAAIPFEEDGEYSFTLSVEDKAGNTANFIENNRFVIDKTKPTMSISFDNNKALNGNYYSSSRTATITVEEKNFDASLINLNIQGNASISSWATDGDIHKAVVSFSTDGEYSIGGNIVDKAGNQSAMIQPENFVIDMSSPEISFLDVVNGKSYNDGIAPSVSVTDENYDSTSLTLTGTRYGSHKELSYGSNETSLGETFTYNNFARKENMDDIYTLVVKAVDKAGNETSEEISFHVNRFGSTYKFDDYTKDMIKAQYVSPSQDFVIIEENVDELQENGIYYTLNGNVTELVNGKDYTVSSMKNKYGWNEYTYRIHTDNIKDDGVYAFTAYSKDKAGNEMDNKSKDEPFTITIDKTKPVLAISGVKEGAIYEAKSLDVSIDVTDNILLKNVIVTLDGKDKTYKAEDITDGLLNVSINESASAHQLKVIATDMAGNQSESENYHFTVSSSKLVTTTKNILRKPIFWMLFVLVVVSGIIFIVLSYKKRKNVKHTAD